MRRRRGMHRRFSLAVRCEEQIKWQEHTLKKPTHHAQQPSRVNYGGRALMMTMMMMSMLVCICFYVCIMGSSRDRRNSLDLCCTRVLCFVLCYACDAVMLRCVCVELECIYGDAVGVHHVRFPMQLLCVQARCDAMPVLCGAATNA